METLVTGSINMLYFADIHMLLQNFKLKNTLSVWFKHFRKLLAFYHKQKYKLNINSYVFTKNQCITGQDITAGVSYCLNKMVTT